MDHVFDRGAHEHRLIEIHRQLQSLGGDRLGVRQRLPHGIDHRDGGSRRVLQDRQKACALSVDADDISLLGEAVVDLGDIAEQHRNAFPDADRKCVELLH